MNQNNSSWISKLTEPLEYSFLVPKSLLSSKSFTEVFLEIMEGLQNPTIRQLFYDSFKQASSGMNNPGTRKKIDEEEKAIVDFLCKEREVTRKWYASQSSFGFKLDDNNNYATFLLLSYKYFKEKSLCI